ncbi:SusC/RagA family TonB-linked outer membrane protein [Pedobacter agri]|uniref:SusC/RagA family TonB-linked outer membrane protein n=1 Tax=Pedobacter agri TaxID=454586 RepID=UPI00292D4837|nr:SusC/RagA family TonB-linked outer membrane protein [Pedobacter agri]
MIKKIILAASLFILCLLNAQAQDLLKGQVILRSSDKGISANIEVLTNAMKFASDASGNFEIRLNAGNYKLRISAVGYKIIDTVVTVPNTSFKIFLSPESQILEDVTVSTGYQQVKRERLTGAYQQLDNNLLNQQVSTNITSRLEAIGNGLSVDRSTTSGRLTIRGLSSISGPKDVLIVLDNFPYDGDIANINPNDVESISILKDAAATSIWGSRAGNGVIVITSKKGKFNNKLNLSASAITTIIDRPNLNQIPAMTSSDYIDVEQFLFEKGAYLAKYNSVLRPGLTPVIETLFDPTLTADQKQDLINGYREHDVRQDFDKYIYEKGINQQYSLQASGGGERYSWTGSGGYDRNQGQLGEQLNRMSLRSSLNLMILKNLKADLSLAYSRLVNTSGRKGYGDITALDGSLYPYAQLADENGNALPLVQIYRLSYLSSLSPRLLDWKYYPLTNEDFSRTIASSNDININTGITYSIKGFDLKLLYRLEHQSSNQETLQDEGSYYTRNEINRFTQLSGTTLNYILPRGGILDTRTGTSKAEDIRLQGSYHKQISHHGIDVFVAGEKREMVRSGANARYYGYNGNTLSTANVDYVNRYPNYITGSTAQIINTAGLTKTNNRFLSLVGNVTYDYKGRYFIYGSVRHDASNLFGASTNNKWKPLWSAGLAWVINKEEFFKSETIDYLKLRGSFGKSGNADPSQVALTTITYSSFIGFTQQQWATITKFYNPELKWETVQTVNIGMDFSAIKGRISGSLDFYAKKGRDLFGSYPIDYTTGISTPVRNVASMNGQGLDLNINSINLKGNFNWETSLNFSTNKDKITKYYNLAVNGDSYVGTTPQISGLIGKPVYAIFSYRSTGLDNTGNPVGFLAGSPSKDYVQITGSGTRIDDLKYHGSALPTVFGNLQNRFSYKQFSLQVAFSYKFGYYFRASSINYTNLVSSMRGHPDYSLRWQRPGDEMNTDVPSFEYPVSSARDRLHNGSEVLVHKADHVRLQYINLMYNIPQNALGKTIKSCAVFLNATNLGILWRANDKSIDPDYQDVLNPSKTLSAGLRINF